MRRHQLWLRDNRICHLCLEEVPLSEASRDHIVPKSIRRDDSAENLALAHSICNSFRMSYPLDHYEPEDYRAERERQRIKALQAEVSRPGRAVRRVRAHSWYCPFCAAANDSAQVHPSRGLPYWRCEVCQARKYEPIGFEL